MRKNIQWCMKVYERVTGVHVNLKYIHVATSVISIASRISECRPLTSKLRSLSSATGRTRRHCPARTTDVCHEVRNARVSRFALDDVSVMDSMFGKRIGKLIVSFVIVVVVIVGGWKESRIHARCMYATQ